MRWVNEISFYFSSLKLIWFTWYQSGIDSRQVDSGARFIWALSSSISSLPSREPPSSSWSLYFKITRFVCHWQRFSLGWLKLAVIQSISSSFARHQTNKKGSTTIIDYVKKIKHISGSLAAVLNPVDEEDLIIHTLNGLPPDYAAFRTSIRTWSSPISIEELHVLLLCEELSLEGSHNTTTALTASKDSGKSGNGGQPCGNKKFGKRRCNNNNRGGRNNKVEAPILLKIDLMISSPIPNSAAKFVTELGILLLTVIIARTIHSKGVILVSCHGSLFQ